MSFSAGMAKKGILSLKIQGAAQLHQHFMPFIEGGGLFVKTNKNYQRGDDVFLILSLDDDERLPVTGVVAWITPMGAQGSRDQGIGIEVSDKKDMVNIKTKINKILV